MLALAALCAPSFGASSSNPPPQVVGAFELAAPNLQTFVLHGTLPVPPGTFPRADGKLPWSIQDSNGAVVASQVEPVTWYPDPNDGADVVEISARVHLAAGTQPGARVQFQVVDHLHDPGTFTKNAAVQTLLNTPNAVTIRTHDVFGNLYTADLLRGIDGVKTLRHGSFRDQVRNSQAMRPTATNYGPPTGPLRRMMAVHSYVSSWAGEDLISLDLRVHNGTSGADQADAVDDPQDKLYFDSLEIVVPAGWTLMTDVPDVGWGTPYTQGGNTVYPIVDRTHGGKMNLMPRQAQFLRRLALVRTPSQATATSMLKEEWLGFCRKGANAVGTPYYSWWNPQTARYFPQRHVLPDLAHMDDVELRNHLSSKYFELKYWLGTGHSSGSYPLTSDQLGWAYPYGNKYGGMTGGTEIFLYDGVDTAWSASNEGYRMYELVHRLYTDRHRVALYNKDGDPTQLSQWVHHGPNFDYVDMQFFLTLLSGPDPFGFNHAPTYQSTYVASNSLKPAYETNLLAYHPIDIQHHIRYLRSPKVMLWLGNDALAKDDLRMSAELLRLSYHDLANSPSGTAMGSGMLVDVNFVNSHPAIGFAFGRGEAWTVDAMCTAYSFADPAWRAQARPWFNKVTQVLRTGQAGCSGFIQSQVSSKDFQGQYHVRRSTESCMIDNSMWSMIESVYRGFDQTKVTSLQTVLKDSTRAIISAPSWKATQHAPAGTLAVGPLSIQPPPFCGTAPVDGISPGADKFLPWSSMAYGYELTGDQLFLQRALEAAGGNNLLNTLENAGTGNLQNRAALIALAQALYGP